MMASLPSAAMPNVSHQPPRAPSSAPSTQRQTARRISEQARVRDVVLGHRSLEHRGALLVGGAAAPERLDGGLRLPALEYVDAAGVHQIRGDGEVQAAGCEAGLFHDAHAVLKVGLALLRVDHDMP